MPFNVAFKTYLDSKATPRCYKKHQHYARPARQRYAAQLNRFLSVQATRLSSTQTVLFNRLDANSAFKETQVAALGNLNADPYPAKSQ